MFENELANRIPLLLAISTCPRCARMKKFLKMYNIDAKIIDIDLLQLGEKKALLKFMQPLNPSLSFPTLIVGNQVVISENYEKAKEVLNL